VVFHLTQRGAVPSLKQGLLLTYARSRWLAVFAKAVWLAVSNTSCLLAISVPARRSFSLFGLGKYWLASTTQ